MVSALALASPLVLVWASELASVLELASISVSQSELVSVQALVLVSTLDLELVLRSALASESQSVLGSVVDQECRVRCRPRTLQ